MNLKRNNYRKPVPKQLITIGIDSELAEYLRKRAANNDTSDSHVIREALRKFIDHYDNESSKGREFEFSKTKDSNGYIRIPVLIPIPLLKEIDSIFKINHKEVNRSMAVKIGLEKMMKRPKYL